MLFFILFLIVSIFVLIFILKRVKFLRLNCITIITGGVKSGKTSLAVHLAIKQYKKVLARWRFRRFFGIKTEKPLLYSNIPLKCKYPVYRIDKSLLLRTSRFAFKSVVLISEASLVADSQNFKDQLVNDSLTCFNKLFGHSTHGGFLFYDTQNISDVHYSIRRACNQYLWIHSNIKVPFFMLINAKELMYDDTNSSVNVFNSDIADDNKLLIVPKSVWNKFDCYCYSILTDSMPVNSEPYSSSFMKTDFILQLRDFKNIKNERGVIDEK